MYEVEIISIAVNLNTCKFVKEILKLRRHCSLNFTYTLDGNFVSY